MTVDETVEPRERTAAPIFGSDVIAAALREQELPYICLNPGASYRGLHDSLVNYLGNERPKIVLCLHEEHAAAIAHGYAAATGRPLAVAVHSTVGLMHASMAIFNAWCARVPMLIIGATGPVDAAKRRPWIDWIHTAADQGALVRDYTKWDDQPASPTAAVESIRRGMMLSTTSPAAPVYINLDATIQEEELRQWPAQRDLSAYTRPADAEPGREELSVLATAIREARDIVILSGRMERSLSDWNERQEFAERIGARVLTDVKDPGSFSTSHPLHLGETTVRLKPEIARRLKSADLIIALDWIDLAGTLEQLYDPESPLPRIVTISNDFHLHRGWSADYQGLPPASQWIATTPAAATRALLRILPAGERRPLPPARPAEPDRQPANGLRPGGGMGIADLARAFRIASAGPLSIMSRPIGWPLDANPIEHPLDFLGRAAGGGIGAGPGMIVGAALALRDMGNERLPVAILGDGDYMMGLTALWTAAVERIPLLVIIANNRSYYNDEEHQKHVARHRGRPEENAPIGQRLEGAALDLAVLARGQGLDAAGPIEDPAELPEALRRAFAAVQAGGSYVLDVIVRPEYDNRSLAGRKSA